MTVTAKFDAKTELLAALKSSTLLQKEVIGGFHNLVAESTDDNPIPFPRIVYQEITNNDDDYADNKATSALVKFQMSIYCDSKTIGKQTPIAKEIDDVMKSIDYAQYDSIDLYETDTKLYHKPVRYSKKIY
ncbi:DUF3168 domain-containing protein [Virgibacillus phage Mimir87]|nr:DUF3168 domain-containing protein [Virgibacillus phage Mimir87]